MFKINIGTSSGKTYKLEVEENILTDKKIHDKIQGSVLNPDLEGYELEIAGASDKSGFTAMKGVTGIGLKKVLLKYGKAMKKRPKKEGKKEYSNKTPKGLRLRKTVRGEVISPAISQINLKIVKQGSKKLEDIFGKNESKKQDETTPKENTEKPAETTKVKETKSAE